MTKYGPESKELWIQARIDELIADNDFLDKWEVSGQVSINNYAKQIATREHAEIESMTLSAQINNLELK